MNPQYQPIRTQLDAIVSEMKAIGFWSMDPPEQDLSQISSYLDVPHFKTWLQYVFVPAAQEAINTGQFPTESMVGVMAMRQYDYHSILPEALNLVKLLHRFDDLVKRLPN